MNVALFGGTFNPPHVGHVSAARACVASLALDRLIFMPAGIPPHKALPEHSATPRQRYEMTCLAARDVPGAVVSDLELRREGTSYTADTVLALRARYPADELWLVVGTDMLQSFERWSRPEVIARECSLAVVARDERPRCELEEAAQHLRMRFGARVTLIDAAPVPASSTEVRAGFGYTLVSPAVADYIAFYGLYRDYDLPAFRQYARAHMSARRYAHTAGCEEMCAELACIHGAHEQIARICAIVHDVTREQDERQQLQLLSKYDIINGYHKASSALLHAQTGAAVARHELQLPPVVIQAVERHTLGAPDMNEIDMILFVADMIEPTRDFPGVEPLRTLARRDLRGAVLACMESTFRHLRAQGRTPDPRSLAAYEAIRQQPPTIQEAEI